MKTLHRHYWKNIYSFSISLTCLEAECQLSQLFQSTLLNTVSDVSPCSVSASFSALYSALLLLPHTPFSPYPAEHTHTHAYTNTHILHYGDRWHWRWEVCCATLTPRAWHTCQPLHHCSTHLLGSPLMDQADTAPALNYSALNCLIFTRRPKAVHFRDSVGSLRLCLCLSAFRGSKEDASIDAASPAVRQFCHTSVLPLSAVWH